MSVKRLYALALEFADMVHCSPPEDLWDVVGRLKHDMVTYKLEPPTTEMVMHFLENAADHAETVAAQEREPVPDDVPF